MSRRRKLFYGLTVAVLAILLILPSTGWLARLQLLPFWERPSHLSLVIGRDNTNFAESGATARQIARTVAQAPNDFDIQFANAMGGENTDENIRRLEALNRKFPHNPVAIATLLRLMSSEQVRLPPAQDRYWLYGGNWNGVWDRTPSAPEQVARFIALAEEGEQLEPNNAYFPMMAAIGKTAAGKSDVGIADWVRAGEKTDWNDYIFAEVLANWKLNETAKGTEIGFFVREFILMNPLYGHCGLIRAMGNWVAVTAVQAERAGDVQTGIRLRRANRQNGQRMILCSKSMVESLVGKRLVGLSAVCPGGTAPTERLPDELTASDPRVAKRNEAYRSYLRANDQTAEARAFGAAVAQGDRLIALSNEKDDQTYFGLGRKTYQLMGSIGVGSLLLTSALFALTFGAIFKLVYRFSPRLQKGQPLQTSTRWGVCLGLVLPALALAVNRGIVIDWCDATELLWAGYAIAGLLLLVPPILLRFSARQIGHGLLLVLATIAALGGLVTTGMVAVGMVLSEVKQLGYFAEMIGVDYGNSYGVSGAAVVVVPLLMLGIFGTLSRVLQVPFAAGVTRGMRATAVPLAALLMILWAGAFLYTLRLDHLATAELDRVETVGEARATAEILHRPFPD